MLQVLGRESLVLLAGLLISVLVALGLGNAGQNIGGLACAILIPIAFCLVRTAQVPSMAAQAPLWRHFVYSLSISAAIVVLLLFEIATELILLGPAPLEAWLVSFGLGLVYLVCYGIAELLRRGGSNPLVAE